MATKNIVPRATGEGKLGTSTRTWKEMHHLTSSFVDASLYEDSNSLILSGSDLKINSGIISGSNNKAIEFDADGNILTLTTGSVVEHNVLAYDGTKWVASASLGSGTSGVDTDAVASMFVSGSHTNISFEHDEVNDVLNASVSMDDAITVTYSPNLIYATMKRTTSQSLAAGWNVLQFQSVYADTSPNTDIADTANNRLVVPAGVTKVKVSAAAHGNIPSGISGEVIFEIRHINSSGVQIGSSPTTRQDVEVRADEFVYAATSIIPVSEGDYFDVLLYSQYAQTSTAPTTGRSNWFTLEVVEGSILNTVVNTTIPDMMTVTYTPTVVHARMTLSTGQSIYDNVLVAFDTIDIDTTSGNVLTDTTNNRFVIPAGVSKVKVKAGAHITSTWNGWLRLEHYDSTNTKITTTEHQSNFQANTSYWEMPIVISSIVDVQQGDYFKFRAYGNGTINPNLQTFAEIEVVEGSMLNTTVNSTISDFTADTLTLSEGVISGSSNKAIEFDSLGNITTLTTGSAVEHNVLAYDGTKWVASASLGSGGSGGVDTDAVASMFVSGSHTNISFEHNEVNDVLNAIVSVDDAITVTYSPSPIHAVMKRNSAFSLGTSWVTVNWNSVEVDTFPSGGVTDTVNNRLIVPAGVTKVKVNARFSGGATTNQTSWARLLADLRHLNSSGNVLNVTRAVHENADIDYAYVQTPITAVSTGDYFDLRVYSDQSTTTSTGTTDWFEIEVVEGSILNTTVNTTIPDMMTVTYTPKSIYATLQRVSSQSITANTWTTLQYDTVLADTSPNTDIASTSNNRLVVPAGVDKVKVSVALRSGTSGTGGEFIVAVNHYDAAGNIISSSPTMRQDVDAPSDDFAYATTSIVSVNQGEYFEAHVYSGTYSQTLLATTNGQSNWFEMEVVEGSVLNTTVNSTISDFTADTLTLSEGVISGSNNKAIEFDSNGNITSFGQSTPSQHDLLAYDGAKWVATGSIDQFFELDANGDLMPI